MIRRLFISGLVGLTAAILIGVLAILLGTFAGTAGKLFTSAYMLPGLALAIPFSSLTTPQTLFPEGGPAGAMATTFPFVIIFWTITFGFIYNRWVSPCRKDQQKA